jgi:hypothetical protein
MTGMRRNASTVPSWLERAALTVRSNGPAAAVAGIAFAGSFGHIVRVCAEHGQRGWFGYLTAGCVDLLCVLGAEERQRDKRIGRAKRGWVSWPALVLVAGISLSLAANLATASPGAWGHVVAGIPAAALLLAVFTLERRASAAPPVPGVSPVAVSGPAAAGSRDGSRNRAGTGNRNRGTGQGTAAVPRGSVSGDLADARRENAEHLAAHGKPISGASLAMKLGCRKATALDLLRELKAETGLEAVNG